MRSAIGGSGSGGDSQGSGELPRGRAPAGVCRDANGVDYYNDSKATNVDAAAKAIGSFAGGIHLILGGKDKNSDYTQLSDAAEGAGKGGVHDWRGGGEN